MNSKDFSWNEMSVVLYGKTIEGITGIKYKVKVEKEFLRGRGSTPLGIVSGNESVEGEIKILQGEFEAINTIVKAINPALKLTDITAVIVWVFERNDLLVTQFIEGVQFDEYEKEMNQGDKMMEITLPFKALNVVES